MCRKRNIFRPTRSRRLPAEFYLFYDAGPNRTNPPYGDMDDAVKKFRSVLESNDPEKKSELLNEMFSIMAAVSPDSPMYQRMMPVLRDMEAFKQDEYSLYAPLPEDVLQAERQAKQAKRETPAVQHTTSEPPPVSVTGLPPLPALWRKRDRQRSRKIMTGNSICFPLERRSKWSRSVRSPTRTIF